MRVYVPFGREWFPYFMRRLGERPANVGFVIRESAPRASVAAAREQVRTAAANVYASRLTPRSRLPQPLHTVLHSSRLFRDPPTM